MLTCDEELRSEITEIFRDVFEYEGKLSRDTSPEDVARWDSLQHIALVRGIEETFQISLSMDEMMEMTTAGAIERLLRRHGV